MFYYYHNDHLGSSFVMTNRSGNLVKHYGYRAYGNERYNNPPENFDVSNRFTGQILDEDTGLYYYGARYYDPKLVRFIQADSMIPDDVTQNSQALNRYSYAFNNPLKFNDPTGNVPVDLEESTSNYLTLLSNTQVVTNAKNSYNVAQNSSFDAGGTTLQGSKSSFHGTGTGTDINGGSGSGTLSGSKADTNKSTSSPARSNAGVDGASESDSSKIDWTKDFRIKKRDRKAIERAIEALRKNSPTTRKLIDELRGKGIKIKIGKKNTYNPKSKTITFNPKKKHIYSGKQRWHWRQPEIGLGHELVHAHQHLVEGLSLTPRSRRRIELRCVGIKGYKNLPYTENRIRADYRSTHKSKLPERRPRY